MTRVPLPEIEAWERAHGLTWCCARCGTQMVGQPSAVARCMGCGSPYAILPTAPYVKGSETSKAAAKSIEHRLGLDAQRVFRAISAAPYGRTCSELEAQLGMRHQTASARIKGLLDEGRIEPSGQKRETDSGRRANVYVRRG